MKTQIEKEIYESYEWNFLVDDFLKTGQFRKPTVDFILKFEITLFLWNSLSHRFKCTYQKIQQILHNFVDSNISKKKE